jgi:D-glycero-D-manno-heptose 1,7-bisphosphate phosphatase
MCQRAVFLDRDGVLNESPPEHQYLSEASAFRWTPGAPNALARLRQAGYALVVVSNQRGVARGLVSWETLREIEGKIQRDLRRTGACIDAFYYCPHEIESACECRKPAPGLLLRAAREGGFDLTASVMIGDAESDVIAGRSAGCRTIRIAPNGTASLADHVAGSLPDAAEAVIAV